VQLRLTMSTEESTPMDIDLQVHELENLNENLTATE
jgi:hypothetical protein